MVKIRLRRMGAKKAPYYRIVVADSRSPRDSERRSAHRYGARPAEEGRRAVRCLKERSL